MPRNITYKPISKDLDNMVKPNNNSNTRISLGLDGTVGEFYYLPIDDLIPFHNQSRQAFNEDEIDALACSIKTYGIRQPLTVLISNSGKYEVISGERRLKAAKKLSLSKVPCILLKDVSHADAVALVENIHRKDLHPIELGITYKRLLEQKIYTTATELAEKISVSKSQVSEYIQYAEFSNEIKTFIIENKISRDKLRQALKAYKQQDVVKTKQIIGMLTKQLNNFSLLKISYQDGGIKIYKNGINNLTDTEKNKLKNYLLELVSTI